MAKGGKEGARPAKSRRAPALPDARGDAPLGELSRDALSVLLYVALRPEETLKLVKALGLRVPGFRTESLSEVERCDVLADEIRAGAEDARALVLDTLREAFGRPPLVATGLTPEETDDLLLLSDSPHGLPMALWRVLADPQAEVRARAAAELEKLAQEYFGPAPEGEGKGKERKAAAAPGADDARVRELERELERARAQEVETRRRAEGQREKLQAQLKEARAREAQAAEDAARARDAAQEAQRARERAEASLAAARATDEAAEAQRARAQARELEGRVHALEARLARGEERERELEESLRAQRAAAPAVPPAAAAQAAAEADEPEEAAATWLMPVYTREFYDSLEGWDRRIQRAAFKQAHLLAQDPRHPSLRALPLEGLPGYYRVRVATDVRLLYRRTERQNTIEVLSLIDREDLDRYIKQAKTR